MSVKVKICGITNPTDALLAVDAGADALGFVFFSGSPRCVTPAIVTQMTRLLPPLVGRIGVFVDAGPREIQDTVAACGLTAVQLHGEETPEFCRQLSVSVVKAFRIRNPDSLRALPEYDTAAWLLDSYTPGKHGGTGATFNWDLACQAKQWKRPIFLAGGLSPANVGEAIRQVLPYAVDVSSSVEERPGVKDPQKLRDFIHAVRVALPEEDP